MISAIQVPLFSMNFRALPFRSVLFAVGLISCSKSDNKDHHVILISIDGFPAWLWNDPSLQVPNLRKLAADGASAKAMTVSNPSITWINHTTLVTGVEPRKHGVLFNGLLVRQEGNKPAKIEPWVDKSKLVHVPTLYDIAHQNGLTTAESDWVAVTRPGTITWSFAELPEAESPIVKEMVAAGTITPEHIEWMQMGPKRKSVTFLDNMWTKAAIHIFKTHRPHLLLYHTLNTDATHHTYGPGTMASHTALAYADKLVGDLIQAVEESGLRDRTTFVISTDHGFKKVSKYVYPNVVLKKSGLANAFGPSITTSDAFCMTQGGMAFVYVSDPNRKAELLPKLKELFAQTEGVERVIDGKDGHTLGMPTPEENQGMGDLVVYAKDGHAFNNAAAGDAVTAPTTNYGGTHGFFNGDPELDGIFIASGRGIKKGIVLERMANLDVAPTMAELMGLKLPQQDGRVLEEILVSREK
jgi:predicted AlkP superfamily pyrophosphatase or phosphodiesterase